MKFDKIAVLDFGGQTAHLIATKVRRLQVKCDILDPQAPIEELREYQGIILSGSPAMSSDGEGSDYTHAIYDLATPLLGFCYGHQEIAKHYGGEVAHSGREYGLAELHIEHDSPLFAGLGQKETVWMTHGDTVVKAPPGFVEIGYTAVGGGPQHRNAAIGNDALKRYGFQFHPEVDDTKHGQEMLANFVFGICRCEPGWTAGNYKQDILRDVRREVGDRHALVLVSGGVDSTVTAKLVGEAIGIDRLHLLHVDSGLMRLDESRRVVEELDRLGLGPSVQFVDARSDFLDALEGVTEPERKRRIIGDTFIDVTNREAARLDLDAFVLGQGTIYPDTIETGNNKRADLIKTHHNRVPIVEQMIREGRVVEPLKDLYKTEVRDLARELGLAEAAIERHPFPGPGLGIRVLCADGPVPADDPTAQAQLDKLLAGSGLVGWVLPLRSVGVKADLRSYEHPVLLQATGKVPDHDRLLALAARSYKEVPGINRCILDLRGGQLAPFDVKRATLTRERLELLRELDQFVMDGLARHGLMATVWQCPTVLVPLSMAGRGRELVVLRPVLSERAMTALPAELPRKLLDEIVEFSRRFDAVSGVAIDLTTKPPGTIEWE